MSVSRIWRWDDSSRQSNEEEEAFGAAKERSPPGRHVTLEPSHKSLEQGHAAAQVKWHVGDNIQSLTAVLGQGRLSRSQAQVFKFFSLLRHPLHLFSHPLLRAATRGRKPLDWWVGGNRPHSPACFHMFLTPEVDGAPHRTSETTKAFLEVV